MDAGTSSSILSCPSPLSTLLLCRSRLRTVDELEDHILLTSPSHWTRIVGHLRYSALQGAALRPICIPAQGWTVLVQHTCGVCRGVLACGKRNCVERCALWASPHFGGRSATNDVGGTEQSASGVALLDGKWRICRRHGRTRSVWNAVEKVYERPAEDLVPFHQPPPPVPHALAHLYPDVVVAQKKAAEDQVSRRKGTRWRKYVLILSPRISRCSVSLVCVVRASILVQSGGNHG